MLINNKLSSALDQCLVIAALGVKAIVIAAACIVVVHAANGLADRFGKAAAARIIIMPVQSLNACGDA